MARAVGTDQFYKFGGGLLYLGGYEIGSVQNVTIDVAMETASLKEGTAMFPFIVENTGGTITGSADYAILHPLGAAGLFGESVSASGVVAVKDETIAISDGGTPSVSNTPVVISPYCTRLYFENTSDGTVQNYKRVTGTPADGEFKIIADGTVTFAASEGNDAENGKISYHYWSNDANFWSLQDSSFPPAITMVLSAYGRNRATQNVGYNVVIANNVRITSYSYGVSNAGEIQISNIAFQIAAHSDGKALEFHSTEA